ncbi:MAG: hypothetical protein ABW168_14220 [Sedimenticola sp.]
MNILLEKSKHIQYYGHMNDIFDVLDGVCEEYDWYVSDIETNCAPPWDANSRDMMINGYELKKIITETDIQFIWAVFSAIQKGVTPIINALPYADGNNDYWVGEPKPQLNGAEFEIVCWDSSLFLLIGLPDDMGQKFISKYTDAIDLDEYNKAKS